MARVSAKRAPKAKAKKGPQGFLGGPPLAIIAYGPSGVGKTSWASYFDNPMFVFDGQEEGIEDLSAWGQAKKPLFAVKAKDYQHTLSIIGDILSDDTYDDVGTVVFDSITGFEKYIFQYHCMKYFDNDWSNQGFYSYQQGPKNAAKTDVPEFISYLDTLKATGRNVILLGHSEVKPYSNPEGPDFDRFNCVCDKATWSQLHRWAQAVFFMNFYTNVEVSKQQQKQGKLAKGKGGSNNRFIYTEWRPAYDAKNRYGLDPTIDMGDSAEESYKNFESEMKEAKPKLDYV
jgi:hypothetical protein